ncbi:DUF4867 family protein [Salibacterium qingdaonense]|uniref:DUF4867 family protein n=1 Tax=Salibacterium qingdaonense TaxID=266892 RepID=UPI000B89150F|nr:DUF4867 family protein [Salibacterium qingdaonense]
MLKKLQEKNTQLSICHVTDPSFSRFGKVLEDFPAEEAAAKIQETTVPEIGNKYVRSVPEWEKAPFLNKIEDSYYGQMPVQIGYCNGNSSSLAGLEYHKGSEINIGETDFILLIGSILDIQEGQFHTDDIHAFYIPALTAVELYQTTLHLAPCKVADQGFKCMVILPSGTNAPLEEESNDPLLFMKNKWLLSHPENKKFMEQGAHSGITGTDVYVQQV